MSSAEPTASATAEPSVNPVFVKAAKVYRKVLDDPTPYLGLEEGVVPQELAYALDTMGEEGVPHLLLQATGLGQGREGDGVLRVMSVRADSDEVDVLDSDFFVGVADAGGDRGSVGRSSLGKGLIHTYFSLRADELTVTRITAGPDGFTQEELCDGQVVQVSCLPEGETSELIAWTDVSDTTLLDELEAGTWDPTLPAAGSEASAQDTADPGTADQGAPLGEIGGLTKEQSAVTSPNGDPVYTGTVRVTDYDGVLALQGQPDPNPGAAQSSPGPYALLVLDQPQEVQALNGDGSGSRPGTASMVLLGSGEQASVWSQYDGQRISVSHPASQVAWPSDTALPLGEPRLIGTATVLSH